jgi:two-component system sensor histidine kinase BaeS
MTSPSAERVAVLVHEVRSPVAALSAVAEAASEVQDVNARRELVRLALDACVAIERIVGDIALASVRAVPLDVGRLVRDVVAAHAASGTDVVASLAPELPLVEADPVRLRQALDNLVTYAQVHGRGPITVRAALVEASVALSVADEGEGIPPGEAERIFESGVRLDERRPGSGFGLALTRAIVEAHGGSIRVEPPSGRGATFTMTLPAAPSQPDT